MKKALAGIMCTAMAAGLFSGMGTAVSAEEIQEISMYTMGIGTTTDYKTVEEAVNAISEAEIGVHVNWTVLDIGQWFEQYNLLLSGSEIVDLMPNFGGVAGGVSQGAFWELEDLYEEYGQGIQEYYPEDYSRAGYIDGHLYGIASQKDYAGTKNITYRQDIVEELGIDVGNVKTLEDWEPVLAQVKEAYPDMYGYVSNGGNSLNQFDTYDWDTLTDGFGVLMNYGQDLTVTNLYETEEYENLCKELQKWADAGYTSMDTATSTETGGDLMKAGKAFCTISTGNPGIEAEYEANTGYDCATIALTDAISSTGNVTAMMWAIPSFSEVPEAAMKFLNLMYTNKEVSDLLNYGIEGVHYEVTDHGYDYIGGDQASCTYHPEMSWIWPNSYIGGYWSGREADLGEQMREFNDSAVKSKAMGFVYDNTNVVNEVTACTNVVKQYAYGLETGTVDVDSVLPEFRQALKDAGIDRIIEEKQAQLDEWLAGQE